GSGAEWVKGTAGGVREGAGAGNRGRPSPLSRRLAPVERRPGALARLVLRPGERPAGAAPAPPLLPPPETARRPGAGDGGLGDRRGHGPAPAGLGGGGAARRGVPLLRPGSRLLPARPPDGLGCRGASGAEGAPPSWRHHRAGARRQPAPAARAAVDGPAALGPQAARRALGGARWRGVAGGRRPAPRRPPPGVALRGAPPPRRVERGCEGVAASPGGHHP